LKLKLLSADSSVDFTSLGRLQCTFSNLNNLKVAVSNQDVGLFRDFMKVVSLETASVYQFAFQQ
jgi:hypothetical protein